MKPFLILFILVVFMSCENSKIIDIQGHRGCRGVLPENTIPAFKKAIELGVHTLELDVAISKDNVVVVTHEPYMNHEIALTPDGKEISENNEKSYNLYQMSFDSIQTFDVGLKKHPRFPDQEKIKAVKPSLSEVFNVSEALNGNIKYNIEIKAEPAYDNIFTPEPKTYVKLVLEVVKKHKLENRVNLQSFDIRILEEIKRQNPTMVLALLVDENEDIDAKLKSLSFKPEIISPYFKLLTKTNVKSYQNNGFLIIPWTVNEILDLKHVISLNVDGIITDFPYRLISILE